MEMLPICRPAATHFDEAGYLSANPDVARIVAAGGFSSGAEHFDRYGKGEPHRRVILQVDLDAVEDARREKLAAIEPLLRTDLDRFDRAGKPDFLTAELRELAHVTDTANISDNPYDSEMLDLVAQGGLILDCGAGWRDTYYPNVVNFEIADYPSTDVLGVGEALPFKDNSFDGVISMAVLEHVKNPHKCAQEIIRVLKPGGRLICGVPFLQPRHGYPHHFFNMTDQGLASLFEGLSIQSHDVRRGFKPIVALTWFIREWADALSEAARQDFLSRPLSDFMAAWQDLEGESFNALSEEVEFTLAAGTYLIAVKP